MKNTESNESPWLMSHYQTLCMYKDTSEMGHLLTNTTVYCRNQPGKCDPMCNSQAMELSGRTTVHT